MSKAETVQRSKYAWLLPVVVTGALFLALYYDVIVRMVQQWEHDPNYSHGFLVPFISLYLLWERRDVLKNIEVKSCWLGLPILILGLFVLVVGKVGAEYFTMRFSMLIVIAGLVLFLGGLKVLKAVALPLGYLIFMIPFPYIVYDAIAFPLKLFAAKNAVWMLKAMNVSVFREGNIIYLASTTLEVADACSGIRSLISLLALGVALAYFTHKSWFRRIGVVILAVPIAIFVNVMRIVITGALAHFIDPELATGFFHEFSGFLMFGVAMAMLIAVNFAIFRFMPRRSKKGDKAEG
ncbi:Eight transmembrane protein EpsH [hydrothermal vent metagenome]|uniref:Eight transmembrane protein EpsH n=1 Tax=hydrothermal vent metagenome TaxID=652676 RepID=A0A3B0RQ30_9ZZZZ